MHSLAKHVGKSILCYRLSALYVVAGVVIAAVHIPFAMISGSVPSVRQEDGAHIFSWIAILSRIGLDIGKPPSSIFHFFRIMIAGQLIVLGVCWDVRRRTREWALIRLYGGHPSLIVGSQVFCLSLLGALVGGGFALLIGPSRALGDNICLMLATVSWGLFFSGCLCLGPIAYTEFFDVVAILQAEG